MTEILVHGLTSDLNIALMLLTFFRKFKNCFIVNTVKTVLSLFGLEKKYTMTFMGKQLVHFYTQMFHDHFQKHRLDME